MKNRKVKQKKKSPKELKTIMKRATGKYMPNKISSQFYPGFRRHWQKSRAWGGGEKCQLLAVRHTESADSQGQLGCEMRDSVESFVSSFMYFRNTNSE